MDQKSDIDFDSITMGNATGHSAHLNTCVKNVMGPTAKSNAQAILKTMPQNNQAATNEEQTKQSNKIATAINASQLRCWLEGYGIRNNVF